MVAYEVSLSLYFWVVLLPEWFISGRTANSSWVNLGFYRHYVTFTHHTWPAVAMVIETAWNRNRFNVCPDLIAAVIYGSAYPIVNSILTAGFGIRVYDAMSYKGWMTLLWEGMFCLCSLVTLVLFYFGKNRFYLRKLKEEQELLLVNEGNCSSPDAEVTKENI